jgi:hypothetical protein
MSFSNHWEHAILKAANTVMAANAGQPEPGRQFAGSYIDLHRGSRLFCATLQEVRRRASSLMLVNSLWFRKEWGTGS